MSVGLIAERHVRVEVRNHHSPLFTVNLDGYIRHL